MGSGRVEDAEAPEIWVLLRALLARAVLSCNSVKHIRQSLKEQLSFVPSPVRNGKQSLQAPHSTQVTSVIQQQIHSLPWHCLGWEWAHADQRAGAASCSPCRQLMPFPPGLERGWKLIRSPAGEVSGWEVPGMLTLGSLAAPRMTGLPGFSSQDPRQGQWCCSETRCHPQPKVPSRALFRAQEKNDC